MNAQELRKLIANVPKFPETKPMEKASVCNDGFPGNFNLSFTEPEHLREFGQYLNFDHNLIFSKIQPCIRHQDWNIIKNNKQDRYRYLSVFDMADIGGAVSVVDGERLGEITTFSTKSLFDFLIYLLRLSPEKLRIKYCGGGSITSLTNAKYPLDKVLNADPMIKLWSNLGVKEHQFIPDESRDTLLALHIYGLPTAWGYRNEIFYEHQGRLLDIATFEYLFLRPIFDDSDTIIDLKKWEHCFVISAIGVERVLMVLNGHKTIAECSHIAPLVDLIFNDAHEKISQDAVVLAEGIRAVHRIVADAGIYQNLSRRRKKKIRDFYNGIFDSADALKIEMTSDTFRKYLNINADSQSYYPELAQSVELATNEIMAANARFENDQSKKTGV